MRTIGDSLSWVEGTEQIDVADYEITMGLRWWRLVSAFAVFGVMLPSIVYL